MTIDVTDKLKLVCDFERMNMNNIVEVAKNATKMMASEPITCPCGERWFSPFDKLYVSAYGKCTVCDNSDETLARAENIFAIIEAV